MLRFRQVRSSSGTLLKNCHGRRWARRGRRMHEAASEAIQDIGDKPATKQPASLRRNPLGGNRLRLEPADRSGDPLSLHLPTRPSKISPETVLATPVRVFQPRARRMNR